MRFTSNAFIVSTVALLSLMIPGVNADVAEIISPSSGETFYPNEMINLIWIVTDTQGLASVNCDIVLLQFGSSPSASGVLQTGVPVLNGISNGPVQIPDDASGDNYLLELISPDQKTVYGQSGTFSIV